MKKIVLFVPFLALLMLNSCTTKYSIKGTVNDPTIADSTQVFLTQLNGKWVNLDTTYVVDGKFSFEGKVDTAKVSYLKFLKDDGFEVIADFVLENGNITVNVDSNFYYQITGTKENDILAKFGEKQFELANKFRKLVLQMRKEKEGARKDSLLKIAQSIEKDYTKMVYDFCLENVNTLAGTHIFVNSNYGFSLEEKENILNKMNEVSKSDAKVKKIIEKIETEKKTAVGQPFVDFTLKSLDGKDVSLSDFVGKTDYLLVDFWASWCGPCLKSLPELKAFYAKNKGAKFDIVGVSLDQSENPWKQAIKTNKLPWHHMSDLKGWASLGAEKYGVRGIPATVLIDKNGKIVGRNMPLNEVQKLLNK